MAEGPRPITSEACDPQRDPSSVPVPKTTALSPAFWPRFASISFSAPLSLACTPRGAQETRPGVTESPASRPLVTLPFPAPNSPLRSTCVPQPKRWGIEDDLTRSYAHSHKLPAPSAGAAKRRRPTHVTLADRGGWKRAHMDACRRAAAATETPRTASRPSV